MNSTFLAAQDDGSFLVAGVPAGTAASTDRLYAEHFGADDTAEGEIFPITSPSAVAVGTNQYPRVFAVNAGNYLLSWLQTSTPAPISQQTFVSYYVASSTNQRRKSRRRSAICPRQPAMCSRLICRAISPIPIAIH